MSSSGRYWKGDVLWAPDPFRQGRNPRLWLVLAADSLPYRGEEYIAAALTTSELPRNHEIDDGDWIAGKDPDRTSYCSPWVVATIKHDVIVNPQGAVTSTFADRMVTECKTYLDRS